MKLKAITMVAVLLLLSVASVPVAAQEEAGNATEGTEQPDEPSNETLPPGAPDDVELVVDDTIALVDYSYQDGTMHLDFYASQHTSIAVLPAAPDDQEKGTISGQTYHLQRQAVTEVSIPSPGGVTFYSMDNLGSVETHYIQQPETPLITGPYTGRDVSIGSIAAALAVSSAVLYGAAIAIAGGRDDGGRIA